MDLKRLPMALAFLAARLRSAVSRSPKRNNLGCGPTPMIASLRLVVGEGLVLAVAGVTVGLAGSYALSKFIELLLFNVEPRDVATFAAAGLVLLVATLVASYIPARRATKADPLVALRYE